MPEEDLLYGASAFGLPAPFVLTFCYAGLQHDAFNSFKSNYALQIIYFFTLEADEVHQ